MESFGERLKKLRQLNGVSQVDLSKTLGVDKATVSRWEKNQYEPDQETIKKIATIFGVTIDYLLGNTVDFEKPHINIEEIKKAVEEKELHWDGRPIPEEEQRILKRIILAAIDRDQGNI